MKNIFIFTTFYKNKVISGSIKIKFNLFIKNFRIMSIAQNPLLGPMRKSMGNFTTTSYNGMNIIRSKAFKKKDAKSKKQLIHRQKIILMAKAYKSFGGFNYVGFPENSRGKSPYNMFLGANISCAFDLTGEMPVISYPALMVSKGTLIKIMVPKNEVSEEGILITYETYIGLPNISVEDEIIAFALLKNGELVHKRQARGSGVTETILLNHQDLQIEEVECCYVFARSKDGKKTSNSTYVALSNKFNEVISHQD